MKTNILPFPRDRISNSFPNPPAFLITEKLQKKTYRMLENSGENDPDFFEQSERQGFRHNGKQAQNGHHNRGKDSPPHEKGPKSRNMK